MNEWKSLLFAYKKSNVRDGRVWRAPAWKWQNKLLIAIERKRGNDARDNMLVQGKTLLGDVWKETRNEIYSLLFGVNDGRDSI